MTEKYYRFINQLVKIGYDEADDPSYCDLWDKAGQEFKRRNDILDDVLNHSETYEIAKPEFERALTTPSGPEPLQN